jgi:hypothetical protein
VFHLAVVLIGAALWAAAQQVQRYDLVVYGGTAGGAITAVSAAREGLRVALLEPGVHIGGMLSGGLSRTDYGRKEVIGGYAREFYQRAGNYYGTKRYGQDEAWFHEPGVGEKILRGMLAEAGVQVFEHHRLKETGGVTKKKSRLVSIDMEDGSQFEAAIFADATYEGDLMAQAGVSYTWGREPSRQYGESLAGVRPTHHQHVFQFPINAYDASGKLLPEIQTAAHGQIGDSDKKVQAYNFRVCVSKDPNNKIPYPKPEKYNSARFELLVRLLQNWEKYNGRPPVMTDLFIVSPIPNNKADINNRGAFSTDYLGKNWEYPDARYARKTAIWKDHLNYTQSLFYFLANDERVPASVRDGMKEWGLPRDEFADTGHWPHQLYVREARRMIGDYVVTQKDIQVERTKPDPIGMGSYNSDSHAMQRFVQSDGTVQNEGLMEVPVQPYQIPYRVMLPKRTEAINLLVPVALSASHVAYSTLRMEPQYMIIGQAAGVAARMAIRAQLPLQDIKVKQLADTLRKQGAVFEYNPARPLPVWTGFAQPRH